jgi:hypothetical protein
MKNKKMLIYGGLIAVVAIGGFLWWKNKNKPKVDGEIVPKPKMDAELTTPKPAIVKEVVETVSTPTGTVEVKRTVGTTRATTTA